MRSVKLADVTRVRFLNPVMENEVRRALEVLSLSHDTQKKAVSLVFTGEGKRQVKVSYVVENPIWKTSYRLVLGKEGKPYLQGWAVVENPSDEDWNNVRMALVSGRPISFQMDLYQPLYVPRPVVEPELFASLRPQTYNEAIQEPEKAVPESRAGGGSAPARAMKKELEAADKEMAPSLRRSVQAGKMAGGMRGFGVGGGLAGETRLGALGLDQSAVASAASAQNLGDFFQYVIDHPVSLPRQKSAMLPIVSTDVEAAKVSIYNEHTLAKHPLLGLRLCTRPSQLSYADVKRPARKLGPSCRRPEAMACSL